MKKSKKRKKAKARAPQAKAIGEMRVRLWTDAARRLAAPHDGATAAAAWAIPLRTSADYVDRDGF